MLSLKFSRGSTPEETSDPRLAPWPHSPSQMDRLLRGSASDLKEPKALSAGPWQPGICFLCLVCLLWVLPVNGTNLQVSL